MPFPTARLPAAPDTHAPDGSEVRLLSAVDAGSMAHFHLASGQVTRAIRHRTVAELWFVVQGQGEIWRSDQGREEVTALSAGVSLAIPAGTAFQFRAGADSALDIVGVTMPPWPGDAEAVFTTGPWQPTS